MSTLAATRIGLLFGLLIAVSRVPIAAHAASLPCGDGPLVGALASPCALDVGVFAVDALYYQNASAAGGTALAAYPLIDLRLGIAPRTQFMLEPPSQIAESGSRGSGLYPTSHAGYGAMYTLVRRTRSALPAAFTVVPPPRPTFRPLLSRNIA